jgi:hypothetical protein
MTEESSPLIFNNNLLMLESIPQSYADYSPAFANCSAYFRVRDMRTLRVIVNISASCGQAFGSATVIPGAGGSSDTLLVTGTQWDRNHATASEGWTGPCAGSSPANCTVNFFSSASASLEDASWVVHAGGVPLPFGVYNTNPMRVPPSAGFAYQWIIALETTAERARFLGSSSDDATDVAAYAVLPENATVPRAPDVGSCPSLRHDGTYFYYLTGGTNIHILRSRDLVVWAESAGVVLNHSDPGDCVVAPSYFGPYVPQGIAAQRLSACGASGNFGDDSDVDLVEWPTPFGNAESGPGVLLEYGSGDQRTFGFSNLAFFNGSMVEFLQSFF